MASATGIHDHDAYKTGLIPTDPGKRLLAINEVLSDRPTAELPQTEDRHAGVVFTLGGNDNFGTCGPTGLDNNKRATSKVALGRQLNASDQQIFALYKTQNPNFVPNVQEPVEDNGVEMGSMLDAALARQLPGYEGLVAFGRSTKTDDATIERLVATFGSVLFAVDLLVAQQAQTDATPPVWDYKKSGQWGGHCIENGKYIVERTASGLIALEAPVITWLKEVGTTDGFREHQLEEVWVPIWQWHLDHPAFLAGVDQGKLAEAFHELTGGTLPVKPSPTPGPTGPTPGPTGPAPGPTGPAGDPDAELIAALDPWAARRHVGQNKAAAQAYLKWRAAKQPPR